MASWDSHVNAEHIDWVIWSYRKYNKCWKDAYYSIENHDALNAAIDVSQEIMYNNNTWRIWCDAQNTLNFRGRNRLFGADFVLRGLVAYDDSAHLLSSDPEQLKVLSLLGDDRAMLFVSGATVMQILNKHGLNKEWFDYIEGLKHG